MRGLFALLIALMLPASAWPQAMFEHEEADAERGGQAPAVPFRGDDTEMSAAIAQAQATLPEFIEALRNQYPWRRNFSLKARFRTPGGGGEHIWVGEPRYDGRRFHGRLGNEPEARLGIHEDDPVAVNAADVSDWMYFDGDKLKGGYTLRVLRSRLSPAERARFDRKLGVVLGD